MPSTCGSSRSCGRICPASGCLLPRRHRSVGVGPAIISNEIDEQVAGWRSVITTPSELSPDPIAALLRLLAAESVLPELRGDEGNLDEIREFLLTDQAAAWSHHFKPAFEKAGRNVQGELRILLIIDQLEELFSLAGISREARAAFLSVLQMLAQSGSVWVLATARADFHPQLQAEPTLVQLKAGLGTVEVLPPAPDALRRLIEDPARLAGLHFEQQGGHSLSDRILRDAAAHRELLPLVEYVLRELFEQRADDHRLTFAVYTRLRGCGGGAGQTGRNRLRRPLAGSTKLARQRAERAGDARPPRGGCEQRRALRPRAGATGQISEGFA